MPRSDSRTRRRDKTPHLLRASRPRLGRWLTSDRCEVIVWGWDPIDGCWHAVAEDRTRYRYGRCGHELDLRTGRLLALLDHETRLPAHWGTDDDL